MARSSGATNCRTNAEAPTGCRNLGRGRIRPPAGRLSVCQHGTRDSRALEGALERCDEVPYQRSGPNGLPQLGSGPHSATGWGYLACVCRSRHTRLVLAQCVPTWHTRCESARGRARAVRRIVGRTNAVAATGVATWVGAAFGHRLGLFGWCVPKLAHEVSVGSVGAPTGCRNLGRGRSRPPAGVIGLVCAEAGTRG